MFGWLRFKTLENGVLDKKTGLLWHTPSELLYTMKEVNEYFNHINQNDKSSWRLPTIKELETIIFIKAFAFSYQCRIRSFKFGGDYWSSTKLNEPGASRYRVSGTAGGRLMLYTEVARIIAVSTTKGE